MDTDILIVGAGPTGLTLACELLRHGISCRLVDKEPQASERSRALAVQARTLEILASMGLAPAFLAAGAKASGARIFVGGREVAAGDFGDLSIAGAAYPFILVISQSDTERLLTQHLQSLHGTIERGWELGRFEMDDDGVTSVLRDSQGAETKLRSRYIVGCDGAHSVVRKHLGIDFQGDAYPQRFLLADVTATGELPRDKIGIFFGKTGVCVFFPFREAGKGRFVVTDRNPDREASGLTLSEMEEEVRFYTGRPIHLSEPRWLAKFHLHHRVANSYEQGRAFIAGDAAHIHSPAGGQGMNTGIQDAHNLAWKLALAVKGQCRDGVLKSYQAERRPIGLHLLARTDRLFSLGSSRNPVFTSMRNFLISTLAPSLLSREKVRRRLFDFVSQLGIRYRRSPLVGESLTGAPASFRQTLPKGHRAPNALFTEGQQTIHGVLAESPSHHLLLMGETDAARGASWQMEAQRQLDKALGAQQVRCHFIPMSPEVMRLYAAEQPCSYLVRPDGYVGFRTYGTGLEACVQFLVSHVFMPASGR